MFEAILQLFAGIGALLLGFQLLSDNMEKVAGAKLKLLFNKTTDKKLVGVGMGAVTTAVIQSSGVTTVMVVGFVNAGIMTLYQATAIIMGANIGTTITAQIVALNTIPVMSILMLCLPVGIFMSMLGKKDKIRCIGLALAGLGLVFLGLNFMSGALATDEMNEYLKNLLSVVTNPFLLLLIGIVFTALIQSSSAVTSIIIAMAAEGILIGGGDGGAVLYVILGSNIGTCVTAMISAIGTNRNAKRACLIHLMFNLFGTVIFMTMLLIWQGVSGHSFYSVTFAKWFTEPSTAIAMFHTFFNVVCTIIFLPATKLFVKLTQIILPDKKGEKAGTVNFIDDRFIQTPALAITQARKEVARLSDLAMDSLEIAYSGFMNKDVDCAEKVYSANEEIAMIGSQITTYLIKVSAGGVILQDEKEINSLHNNTSDLVRISELADNLTKYTRREVNDGLTFSPIVGEELEKMYAMIKKQHDVVGIILENKDASLIPESDRIEDEIDAMRKSIIAGHIDRMNKGECKAENNSVFVNLVSNLERIGDHFNYVAHSVEFLQ